VLNCDCCFSSHFLIPAVNTGAQVHVVTALQCRHATQQPFLVLVHILALGSQFSLCQSPLEQPVMQKRKLCCQQRGRENSQVLPAHFQNWWEMIWVISVL